MVTKIIRKLSNRASGCDVQVGAIHELPLQKISGALYLAFGHF
jgi:hypothetical protein